MSLRLVTGRANAGKSGTVYSALKDAVKSHRPAYLLLPTTQDVDRAREEWSKRAPLGLEVTTFTSFTVALWERYGDGRRVCTPAYRTLSLSSLARSLKMPKAMAALAAKGIEILCRHTGDSWRSAQVSRVPDEGRRFAELVSSYAALLGSRGLVEEGETLHLLASSELPIDATIVIHRFSDFAEDQLLLLEGLAKTCDVIVTLTWERGHSATQTLTQLVDRIHADMHDTLFIKQENIDTVPELQLLEAELFAPRTRLSHEGAIRLTLADGVEAEAQAVCAEVALALADQAASSPDRIVVAYRDLGAHRGALARALARAGISASFESLLALRETSFGAAALNALEFCSGGDRAALLAVVRSPFSGLAPDGARLLEARVRRLRGQAPERMLALVRSESNALASRLARVSEARRRALTSGDLAAMTDLINWLFSQSIIELHDRDTLLDDAAAHRATLDLFREAETALDEGVLLSEVVEALGEVKTIHSRPERPGYVQVMDATRLRGRRFDTVIVGGLSRGEFPAPVSEALFSGAAADRVLRAFGAGERAVRGPEFDQALFYDVITRARKRIVLSACAQSDTGEPLGRSPLFEAVADFLRLGEGEDAPEPVERYIGFSERPDPEADDARVRARAVAMEPVKHDERADAAARRLAVTRGRAPLPGLLGSKTVVSASQIEAYLACPYRWFYQYVLRPGGLEESFGAREEGEWAHRLLAEVYRRLIEEERLPLAERELEFALGVLGEIATAEEATRTSSGETSLAGRIGDVRVRSWGERIVREDASIAEKMVPAQIEWDFGRDDDPVDLGGGLRLVGRVDRIDIDSESGRAVVIDYKRSDGGNAAAYGAAKLLDEGRVQLPLYLLAVRERLGVTPVAGLYRGLSKPFARGMAVTGMLNRPLTRGDTVGEEEFEAILEHAAELGREAVAGMCTGEIPARPRSPKACQYCPVVGRCGGGC